MSTCGKMQELIIYKVLKFTFIFGIKDFEIVRRGHTLQNESLLNKGQDSTFIPMLWLEVEGVNFISYIQSVDSGLSWIPWSTWKF